MIIHQNAERMKISRIAATSSAKTYIDIWYAGFITHFDRERKHHRERQKGARSHKAKAKQKPGKWNTWVGHWIECPMGGQRFPFA
jgi:hypothetical protein